ncbi:hypothetical protein IFM89_014621 [Coptis chinensis]|uniref:Uncharacterized protein n=1 Tax=Coptis chinensis TaxID=261450 RepID=A0A835MEG6_9MAGN|nr:hypothetical protein IFM89_014621 [Coptis chinensis]
MLLNRPVCLPPRIKFLCSFEGSLKFRLAPSVCTSEGKRSVCYTPFVTLQFVATLWVRFLCDWNSPRLLRSFLENFLPGCARDPHGDECPHVPQSPHGQHQHCPHARSQDPPDPQPQRKIRSSPLMFFSSPLMFGSTRNLSSSLVFGISSLLISSTLMLMGLYCHKGIYSSA